MPKKCHLFNMLFFVLLLSIFALVCVRDSSAAGTLITISSTTYDMGRYYTTKGIAVDSLGNAIVAGYYYANEFLRCEWRLVRYDNDLKFINFVDFGVGKNDIVDDITVDKNDNIIATGHLNTIPYNDFSTVKYNNDFSTLIASDVLDISNNDYAFGVAVDDQGNTFIVGQKELGDTCVIVKYDSNFEVIRSTYYGSGHKGDIPSGVAIDSEGNVIVAGYTWTTNRCDIFVLKYNNDLTQLLNKIQYDHLGQTDDRAWAVAVDNEDNIIVGGCYVDKDAGVDYDCLTLKFSSDLSHVLKSATYGGNDIDGEFERVEGVAVDSYGNIIVVCSCSNTDTFYDFVTIKYDSNLNLIASHTCTQETYARGIALDKQGNIFITGEINAGSYNTARIIKYLGSPYITSLNPVNALQGETLDIELTGANFYPGVKVSFSGDGISVNSVDFSSESSINVNVTISDTAEEGKRDIIATNIDEACGKATELFEIKKSSENQFIELTGLDTGEVKIQGGSNGYVNPDKGETLKIFFKASESGVVKVKIYTLRGRLVWEESKDVEESSFIEWDCKNSESEVISSGVYIVFVKGPGIDSTKKAAIIR